MISVVISLSPSLSASLVDMVFKETKIKIIKEVTEPLKEEILKGDVHTIDEMKGMAVAFGLQQY